MTNARLHPHWKAKRIVTIREGLEANILEKTKHMMCAIFRIAPGTETEKGSKHGGEEYKYVISGRISLKVGDREYKLGPGDSIWHKGMASHRVRNDGYCEAVYLTINSPPSKF